MPPYYEGSHERIFMGMQCGTLVATDRSTYLEECFTDAQDILFYNTHNIDDLSLRIKDYLSDPVKARHITERALQLSSNHTWASRALAILEISDMIQGQSPELFS